MRFVFRATCAVSALAAATSASPVLADAADAADGGGAPIVVTGERLNGIDVSATKTGVPLRDTPQSVVTLDRARLDDQAVQSLGEALRYVPGVTLGQGEGHRDQVVLRGQASTADFFLDGVRDDAQYYRPLFNIQRIEVIKGANALLFGRGGGGGAVNRVSKVPDLGQNAVSLAGGVDSFGAWSLSGDGNLALGESAALRLTGTYEQLANHRDFFDGEFIGVAPTLAVALGERTRLSLAYEYDRDYRVIERGVPSLAGRPIAGYDRTFFGSPTLNRGGVKAHFARARITHELTDGLTFDATGQFATYDKYYANVLPSAATASTVTLTGYEDRLTRENFIGQANLVWKGRTGTIGHTLLAGAEFGDQDSTAQRRNVVFGSGTAQSATVPLARTITLPALSYTGLVTASSSQVSTRSVYLQDQIELTPWLQVIGGARYDRFEITSLNRLNSVVTGRSDGKWSPRLGVVLKPAQTVSVYASYAKSFLPQTGDQFNTLAPSLQSLVPEAFRNLELGAKWDVTPTFNATAALFEVTRSNTRVADPANAGFFVLTGSSRVRGAELALSGRITPAWQASAGYTYQAGEIRTATSAAPAGRQLEKLPRHQASLWSRYDLTPVLGVGLGVVHQSSQFATISNAVRLPGFTRIDAAAYLTLSDRLSFQLNVENLTDTAYYASAHTDNNILPGAPLSAKVTARLKF